MNKAQQVQARERAIAYFEKELNEAHDRHGAYAYCGKGLHYTMALDALREKQEREQQPEIVCLCGSTRFFKTFEKENFRLTLEGKIVLNIGCNTKSDDGLNLTIDDKIRLDELHKRKIDLCDSVLVLNVGGYIGKSTQSEIEYASKLGKPIKYLFEPVQKTTIREHLHIMFEE